MKISIIVAKSENDAIGINNQLPWHLPADLKYFKSLTSGHSILMGRKTFESIGRALPNRENIVITRDTKFAHEGIVVKHSIEDAINYCRSEDEIFIIGGDNIYKQTIEIANRLYITNVHTRIEKANAFFPLINEKQWSLTSSEFHAKDEKNEFDYSFDVYDKITQD